MIQRSFASLEFHVALVFVNSRNHHTIQYVIDNGVPGFTRKICFSNFNLGGIERSFDINPTFTTYK